MAGISEIYTDEVYKHLRPLHAAWEPGRPLELGYFGLMDDRIFTHEGNIFDIVKDIGDTVDLEVVKDEEKDQRSFSSKDTKEVRFYANGATDVNGVVRANASVDIEFKGNKGVFFNAAECEYDMFANKVKLEKIILKLLEGGHWKKEWVIVTDIVHAGATTVVVSGGKQSSITLEAGADVEKIDLADASVRLRISHEANVGYRVVSSVGMSPLIGLAKVKRKLWGPKELKPLMKFSPEARKVEDFDEKLLREESVESLYLGQIE